MVMRRSSSKGYDSRLQEDRKGHEAVSRTYRKGNRCVDAMAKLCQKELLQADEIGVNFSLGFLAFGFSLCAQKKNRMTVLAVLMTCRQPDPLVMVKLCSPSGR